MLASGEVEAACSEFYLITLALEVLRARAFPLVKLVQYPDVEEQIRRLQFLTTEVSRLFRAPGLFPSSAARIRFTAIIALDANLQFVQAVKEILLRKAVGDIAWYNHVQTRPSYLEGSKGWENFYLNMAPGFPSEDPPKRTTLKSSYQIVPTAGMRVVGDLHRESRFVAQWIKEVSITAL